MIKAYGIAHATLTVSDIRQTKEFYEKLLGEKIPMDDEKSFSLLKAGIPCWFVQWDKESSGDRFNERRVGLDHIAFELKTLEELKDVVNKLNKMAVKNAGIEKFADKFPYVAFRDPDNIQIEFFINEI